MLRDLKFLRRNSVKNPAVEETENVPVKPTDSSLIQTSMDPSRPPFSTIQEPGQKSEPVSEQEAGFVRSKVAKTPTKVKGKSTDAALPLRTPEKQLRSGISAKNRFGWGQKNEPASVGSELRDGGSTDGREYAAQSSRGVVGVGNGAFSSMTPRSNRTGGRPNSSHSESNSTQSTPTKSVTKPPNPGHGRSKTDGNGSSRAVNFAALYKGMPISCVPPTVVNTVEVPHFELKEDPSFWMDHNVQVLIRVRPLNSMERSVQGYNRCLKQESGQTITWIGQPETRFTFDQVACETVDQETLFRMAGLPMVENCLSGYNSCMFAYGQTGSGKTYTMLGEIEELEVRPSPFRGMTPRIFEFLFARIRAEEEIRRDERLKYYCKCSFLEIYNEQITDLLDPSSTNLLLREDIKKGVYVENLSEFEVQTVGDILKLLTQGSSNRKVAATNMNRESSRSHSVFTCVIESRWEKDSSTNLRFARLNLVDLAGSERQKSSGAEGERLKEAANINKSLSTLGHVIMVLVEVAHGKPKHVPYRDSRLTFLLQDSLGGNSKTMIIANVSPSICCAAETLNTLKFAQRAKLIQNNAVVNEDSSGDVTELQHQIRLLKEELSALKHQNVSRSLSFGPTIVQETAQVLGNACTGKAPEDQKRADDLLESESKGNVRMSSKQLKCLESTLAGALRREQMAETSIKQLEAEIEQLNRLVCQREEDSRSTKMMLRFREDKIQRMESLIGGLIPPDTYLLHENCAMSEEIQLLQAKLERNPEVTRFALENIRLLDQLRRFQDFYEEGERDILLAEVSELQDQLLHYLDGNPKQHSHPNLKMPPQERYCNIKGHDSLDSELKHTLNELEECRNNLNSCLEDNAKLCRDIDGLRSLLNDINSAPRNQDGNVDVIKDSLLAPPVGSQLLKAVLKEKVEENKNLVYQTEEEIMTLQLELDILKILLQEEKSSRVEVEEKAVCLSADLEFTKEKVLLISKQSEDAMGELKDAKSVIEALESQQILLINEMEDLRKKIDHYVDLLREQEIEVLALKEQLQIRECRTHLSLKHSESEDSSLPAKLGRMQASLEKAKRLNLCYQNDHAFQTSNEEEKDEVRREVEAETAEVIVCLQEELGILQQQVQDNSLKERETKQHVMLLETELNGLQEKFQIMAQDYERLGEKLEEKDGEIKTLSEEWNLLTCEIEEVLVDGHEALLDVSDQLDLISNSFPQKRTWISAQVCRMIRIISEKELLIEELNRCLENASNKRSDVDCMLKSLRGATLVITEAHQQELNEKEKEVLLLKSNLRANVSNIEMLENRIKLGEDHLRKASVCATAAFVVVNRLSELNLDQLNVLEHKDIQLNESAEINLRKDDLLQGQAATIEELDKQVQFLLKELKSSEETCGKLRMDLTEEQKRACSMEQKLENIEENDILKAREKLDELTSGVSTLRTCMSMHAQKAGSPEKENASITCMSVSGNCEGRTDTEVKHDTISVNSHFSVDSHFVELPTIDISDCSFKLGRSMCHSCVEKKMESGRTCKDMCDRDVTILLLKKEIESALESLKEVQVEIAKLRDEKEEILLSKKQSQESMKYLMDQVLSLQAAISNFEEHSGFKLIAFEHKLQTVEQIVQDTGRHWCRTKELVELEVGDAKLVAAQKTAEACCILAKFEEVQETMNEADIMINGLMIANETMKLEIKGLKNEKDVLSNEVQRLQSMNDLKHLQYESIEKELGLSLVETRALVVDLEDIIAQIETTFEEEFKSIAHDIYCMKSQVLNSTKLMHSWLEDIWTEIILKDCAMSVLQLCHMGILLEAVAGLNAENGLLHHGLCESNSFIADLREHNLKSKRELEMCRILKGKLLADIKNNFDRILRKEEETGDLSLKLITFGKKISDLQLQEELMLQRSTNMGAELLVLMKELNTSNTNFLASLLDHENLLRDKEEIMQSQAEIFMIDVFAKDFQSLILASTLEEMAVQGVHIKKQLSYGEEAIQSQAENFMIDLFAKDFQSLILASALEEMDLREADMEKKQISYGAVLENLKEKNIFLEIDAELKELFLVDKEVEVALLQEEVEETEKKSGDLLAKLSQSHVRIAEMHEANRILELDVQLLKDVSCSNDSLKSELSEVLETKVTLLTQVQTLEAEYENLLKELKLKETALELSSSHIIDLDLQNQKLQEDICLLRSSSCEIQNELDLKNAKLNKMSCLEEENESLKNEVRKLKTETSIVFQDLEEKKSDYKSSLSRINVFDMENRTLRDKIISLETCIASLQSDMVLKDTEVNELQHSQSLTTGELRSKIQDLQVLVNRINALKEENIFLRTKFSSYEKSKFEVLTSSSFNTAKCCGSVETVDMMSSGILNKLNQESTKVIDKIDEEIYQTLEKTSKFVEELESLECLVQDLLSENLSLQAELLRKDEISKGLLFDISLLQESASNTKDRKDEFEDLMASLEALEDELAVRTGELDEAVARSQILETQLREKTAMISTLQIDISNERNSIKLLSNENTELRACIGDISAAKSSLEKELTERRKVIDGLETELFKMGNALDRKSRSIDCLKSNLHELTNERDHLQKKVLILKENLDMAEARAEENEAVAAEAQQIAESGKIYAEEKEEEVKLLERSVEELECTVNVLENKVNIIKEEAERQRLQREELELELHAVRHQMQNVKCGDAEIKRHLDEKEKKLQETIKHIQILERDITDRDAEIAQCKAHISELNLHADAQACEYKQKYKALETMFEQVRAEGPSTTHVSNSSSNKSEKNAAKSRGSGSPFKCMGLGLVQQIKSENDEELTAGRLRIEELEALAASRQKEIFMLHARLAAAESMTHDVIRDLVGVRKDMTNYASLVNNQQVHKITEKAARLHSVEFQVKEEGVIKLKQQLSEFIEERKGWLEEIDRKQAEMVAAHIALEKLRQKEQLLKAENEMLKMENANNKKKVMQLEGEIKKLSGQQNLHQRIHHHAKIKEENNLLRIQNEELSTKLRRSEVALSRVKEELAVHRTSTGKSPYINFDEEHRLNNKLKETEEEKLQLAQKLLGLCTSILKAAGMTRPVTDISLPVAEEALEQLRDQVTSLERELQDLKFKNRIAAERIRLSELIPNPSPPSSRADDKCQSPRRVSQAPFFSALDR